MAGHTANLFRAQSCVLLISDAAEGQNVPTKRYIDRQLTRLRFNGIGIQSVMEICGKDRASSTDLSTGSSLRMVVILSLTTNSFDSYACVVRKSWF